MKNYIYKLYHYPSSKELYINKKPSKKDITKIGLAIGWWYSKEEIEIKDCFIEKIEVINLNVK